MRKKIIFIFVFSPSSLKVNWSVGLRYVTIGVIVNREKVSGAGYKI